MDSKPLSVLLTLAEHFHLDAVDFATRFDFLWEAGPLMHKMGRTKTFIDLLMGCECALKAHCFLSHLNEEPSKIYSAVRRLGHKIGDLADYAAFLQDRSEYDRLKSQLANFPIFLRYSLDAYETFFPSFIDREAADLNYSKTIGDNAWVSQVRASLDSLNTSVASQFSGFVTDDIGEIFAHERAMKELAKLLKK
ncbi:MAG: hypothetical protein ACOH2B_01350 [Burkholderiaceae bacterium]